MAPRANAASQSDSPATGAATFPAQHTTIGIVRKPTRDITVNIFFRKVFFISASFFLFPQGYFLLPQGLFHFRKVILFPQGLFYFRKVIFISPRFISFPQSLLYFRKEYFQSVL